jgi:cytidylate kinase
MERPLRSGNRIDDVQVRHWLVERERARRREVTEGGVPVITISREYGAQGAAVGHIVAERLGFRFWEREMVSEHDDVRALAIAASTLAARGGAVMVGRGLGFLLSPERALRVRVVCPLEQRIAGLMERQGLTHETARATIEYADRTRRVFVRDRYGRDIDDSSGYDLWVSTGTLGLDAAAAVIIAAYRYRFGERVMRQISSHASGQVTT